VAAEALQDMELEEDSPAPATPCPPSLPGPTHVEPQAEPLAPAKRDRSPVLSSHRPPPASPAVTKADNTLEHLSKTATSDAPVSKSNASENIETPWHLRAHGRVRCLNRKSNNHLTGCATWGCTKCSRCDKCSTSYGPVHGCKPRWFAPVAQ
jgi:hypothetical protein